jgi:hypothetical protein
MLLFILFAGIVSSKLLDVLAVTTSIPTPTNKEPDIKAARTIFIVHDTRAYVLPGLDLAYNVTDDCFSKYLPIKYPILEDGRSEYVIGFFDESTGEVHKEQIRTATCRKIKRYFFFN